MKQNTINFQLTIIALSFAPKCDLKPTFTIETRHTTALLCVLTVNNIRIVLQSSYLKDPCSF